MRIHTKLILTLGIAIMFVLLLGTTSFADSARGGVVTGSIVNIRKTPSVSGDWMASVTKNTKVIIYGQEGSWYRIGVNGVIGYTSAEYIIPSSTETSDFGYGVVTGSFVYIRQSASTDSMAVATLADGSYVQITGVKDGWLQVKHGKFTGFMHPHYVEPSKPPVTKVNTVSKAAQKKITEGQRIVNTAKQYIGIRYTWGGVSPSQGFDCSGFTQYVYRQCGYTLFNRTRQYTNGVSVKYANLIAGDLVFFATNGPGQISHVGIYVGNGQFIHAPRPGKSVEISSMAPGSYYYNTYVCARRVV